MGVRRWYISDWSMMRNGLRTAGWFDCGQSESLLSSRSTKRTDQLWDSRFLILFSLSVFYPVAAAAAAANVRVFLFSFLDSRVVVWCVWYTLRMLYLLNIFSLLLIAAKGDREREPKRERGGCWFHHCFDPLLASARVRSVVRARF